MSSNRTTAGIVAALHGRRWNAEDAEEVLAAWRASGLSAQQFALDHELDPQRLWWWQRKLGGAPAERRAGPRERVAKARLVPAVIAVAPRVESWVTIRVGHAVVELDAERVSAEWVAVLVARLGSE